MWRVSRLFANRYILGAHQLGSTRWVTRLSAIAIAIVVAAMVAVLAVFAGYVEMILADSQGNTPDLIIKPHQGKVLDVTSPQVVSALEHPCVAKYATALVADGVVVVQGHEVPTQVYGVDSGYSSIASLGQPWSDVQGGMEDGEHSLVPMISGAAVAWRTGLGATSEVSLVLYLPRRTGFINPLNPQSAIRSIRLQQQGVLKPIREDIDHRIFIPRSFLAEELDYLVATVSHIEVTLEQGYSVSEAKGLLREHLDEDMFDLLDQEEQRPELTWLIRAERVMVYIIMLFILLLAASCLSSSLVMLMLEKKDDLNTLYAMGSTLSQRAGIFATTGWYISSIGIVAGLALGLILCVLQSKFSLLTTGEGLMMMPFPIAIRWQDITLIALGCSLVTLVSTLLPSIFVRFIRA